MRVQLGVELLSSFTGIRSLVIENLSGSEYPYSAARILGKDRGREKATQIGFS